MKKTFLAIVTLGVILLTGCSMEQKVTIHQDFSSDVVMDVYTTSDDEEKIMNTVLTGYETYADFMEQTGFQYLGVKMVNGKRNNVYSGTSKNSVADTNDIFETLSHEKAIMNLADSDIEMAKLIGQSFGQGIENIEFLRLNITYPFKVVKANGVVQADGYTVVYDVKDLVMKNVSQIYAYSASALKGADKITIKGVKNKRAYKKPVTVSVDAGGFISSFQVNGKEQSTQSYKASKDGTYKVVVTTQLGNKKTIKFYVDRKKPTTNIKNNKTYKKTVKITFKDGVSGIKKATLNGKKIKSGKKVKKNGKYTLKIVDNAGNVKTVKFNIMK